MRRRLTKLATVGSAIVAVLLVAFWVRGFFTRDRIAVPIVGRYYVLSTFPHHFYLDSDPGWNGMRSSAQFGLNQYPAVAKYLEVRLIPRGVGSWSLAIPIWLPLLFLLALPCWQCGTYLRKRIRKSQGLCPDCGYDVRATPERCPECGRWLKHGRRTTA